MREKRYDCVRSLVADGLVTMYLELRAPLMLQHLPAVSYNESPYMTLNKRKLRALTRESTRLVIFYQKIYFRTKLELTVLYSYHFNKVTLNDVLLGYVSLY